MMSKLNEVDAFIRESNKIEGITNDPSFDEIKEFNRFMSLRKIEVQDLIDFVKVYQPNARLRDDWGLNVQVGYYRPPAGHPNMALDLEFLLNADLDAFSMHIEYEKLHPFTDCNGRSGRMLWAWQVQDISLGFLHKFYYQTLSSVNR